MTIWVLGATGRSGRGIAAALQNTGHDVTVAGRDETRLRAVMADTGASDLAIGSLDELLGQLRRAKPQVVVSTIGPFAETAARVIDACAPGTHYVDIGNELGGFSAVLDRDDWARQRGSTFVVGAGYGVIATECCAVFVCEGYGAPASLRVDAMPSLASEAGVIGEALAGSMLGEADQGGRWVHGGKLVRHGMGGDVVELTTPDGHEVTTTGVPTGDLLAAWRTTGAQNVVAGNSMLPSGRAIQITFPAVSFALRAAPLKNFAISRLAKVKMKAAERPREFSWGHAMATWNDGTTREVWLRLGDAQEVTIAGAVEVARRLAAGEGRPGAFTPGALFGADLATAIGGTFL